MVLVVPKNVGRGARADAAKLGLDEEVLYREALSMGLVRCVASSSSSVGVTAIDHATSRCNALRKRTQRGFAFACGGLVPARAVPRVLRAAGVIALIVGGFWIVAALGAT